MLQRKENFSYLLGAKLIFIVLTSTKQVTENIVGTEIPLRLGSIHNNKDYI